MCKGEGERCVEFGIGEDLQKKARLGTRTGVTETDC